MGILWLDSLKASHRLLEKVELQFASRACCTSSIGCRECMFLLAEITIAENTADVAVNMLQSLGIHGIPFFGMKG